MWPKFCILKEISCIKNNGIKILCLYVNRIALLVLLLYLYSYMLDTKFCVNCFIFNTEPLAPMR